MVAPTAGTVVLVRFPFSDLSSAKLHPAVVLASAGCDNWILCQVTSKPYADPDATRIQEDDFATGSLRAVSYVWPGKLFTANMSLMVTEIGSLKTECFQKVVAAVVDILQSQGT